MRKIIELGIISSIGALLWIFSFFSYYKKKSSSGTESGGQKFANDFFQFLKQFALRGGLRNVFPGDDSRDTSVQFELISQVNCTTSVGKPISVTVRNTPTDRRRMRMFGAI